MFNKAHISLEAKIKSEGYPAYVMSVGWSRYSDERIKQVNIITYFIN